MRGKGIVALAMRLSVAALTTVCIVGCGSTTRTQPSAPPRPLSRVKQVVDHHADQIIGRYPRANGVGAAAAEGYDEPVTPAKPAFVLLVTVRSNDDVPADPQRYHGVPISFKVAGEIRAQ